MLVQHFMPVCIYVYMYMYLITSQDSHQKSIQCEQLRANEAEERLKKQSLVRNFSCIHLVMSTAQCSTTQHEEHRVASLETKLSSLSEMVGNYDRQREQDQVAIL